MSGTIGFELAILVARIDRDGRSFRSALRHSILTHVRLTKGVSARRDWGNSLRTRMRDDKSHALQAPGFVCRACAVAYHPHEHLRLSSPKIERHVREIDRRKWKVRRYEVRGEAEKRFVEKVTNQRPPMSSRVSLSPPLRTFSTTHRFLPFDPFNTHAIDAETSRFLQ